MAWTQAQQTAIETRDCGLIVSAAAGSGKTSVLVERLVQILMDPTPGRQVPADRMIVVTFTNDAAAEMKARLSQALELQLQRDPENQWLYQQQMLLQSAHISTISSFCFDLIRDNLTDSGITSAFRILNATESSMLAGKAADQVLSDWHLNRKEDMQLLWQRFCEKSDQPIEQILLDLHNFLASIPFREQWERQTLAQLDAPYASSIYSKKFVARLMELLDNAWACVDEAYQLSEDIYDSVSENNVLAWVEDDYSCIRQMRQALQDPASDLRALFEPFQALKQQRGRSNFPRKKKTMTDLAAFERVKQLREQYKTWLKAYMTTAEMVLPYVAEDLAENRRVLPLFLEMEQQLCQRIWQAKVQKNALGFEDGERMALELLAQIDEDGAVRPSALAQELSEYYQLIMIDEYQDSNNKQDVIFKLLSRNCLDPETGELRYGDNVFLVGDVKQAIYRFRLANPQNFVLAIDAATSPNSVCRHITLNANFRSAPPVLHFVNFVCGNLMRPACGEVAYDQDQALYPGAKIGELLPQEQQAVQVAILSQDEDAPPVQQTYAIQKIQQMIRDQHPVAEKDGTLRPCRYGDFCILLRNNTLCREFAHALADAGIPVESPEEKGYLRAREISILLDMLRVLDNPLLDTAMAAIMLSPMFWFTAQELLEIRDTTAKRSLYVTMMQLAKEEQVAPVLLQKIQNLLDTIQKLRQNVGMMSLESLVRRIYDRTDFLSVMQLAENGDRKRANLQLLLQYVRQYEQNTDMAHRGLSGFLSYIDWLLESKNDFQQTALSNEAENAVVIKTMHRSKGLEFPFVILGELESDFTKQEKRKNALFSDANLAGFCLKDPSSFTRAKTLPIVVLEEEIMDQTRSEELRLLYVAMTRARQQLFLPLCLDQMLNKKTSRIEQFANMISDDGTLPLALVKSASSMAHWIWMCLILRHDAALAAICPLPKQTWETPAWTDGLEIQYTDSLLPEEEPEEATDRPSLKPDPAVVAEIQRMVDFSCASQDSARESLLSVTALLETKQRRSLVWKRPAFTQQTEKLTGAERGTAIHAFFQYANFKQAADDLPAELERLVHHGFLTPVQAAEVTPEIVTGFFQDPIYHRFCRSHHILREQKFLVRCRDLQPYPEMPEILAQYGDSDTMIRGMIDMAFAEPEGYVVVDYKTDAVGDPGRLIERYREQLLIYCAALSCITQKPVSACYLYSTHLKQSIPVERRDTL